MRSGRKRTSIVGPTLNRWVSGVSASGTYSFHEPRRRRLVVLQLFLERPDAGLREPGVFLRQGQQAFADPRVGILEQAVALLGNLAGRGDIQLDSFKFVSVLARAGQAVDPFPRRQAALGAIQAVDELEGPASRRID